MNILITGGAGFIGSNFCQYAVNKYPNDNFICLDALTYAGNMENLKDVLKNTNFTFVKGDICDINLIDELFQQYCFDIVINFAAETDVDRSIENSSAFIKTNVIGVQVLLDVCKKYGIKRFHQVSTDEVYGDLSLDDEIKFYENSPLKPSNPYSASKAAADMLVIAYNRTYGVPITISRSSNNYGKHQHIEKLIAGTITKALQDKKITIHGTGEYVRDWLYVLDNCEAIDLIVRYGKNGEIYNIGANNELSNIKVVNKILKYLNKDKSLIVYVDNRLGQDIRYALDISKIQKQLNWRPRHDFEKSLYQTIEWYKSKYKQM